MWHKRTSFQREITTIKKKREENNYLDDKLIFEILFYVPFEQLSIF